MIPVQILLIAIGALLADADKCSCECDSNDVCDEQSALRTELDENTVELTKLNRHYDFVRSLAKDWQSQVAHVVRQQLKAATTESVDGLKNPLLASLNGSSIQKEDQIARMESFETSVRELLERAAELDFTMEKISEEMNVIRTELHRIQNGPKCGVDFDNDGNNTGGNDGSGLVWPWMAAVYNKEDVYGCDGSIIHRYFVLTSAWCVSYFASDGLSVKLGLSDLKKKTYLQEYKVKTVHRHPRFYRTSEGGDNHDYDIALLELEQPIKFGPFVRTICLPPTATSEDETFYMPQSIATAVALDDYIEATSKSQNATLVMLDFTILHPVVCRRKLQSLKLERIHTSPGLSFCASSSQCPREGSPVMQSRLTGDGTRTWTQVGIRSWNVNCKDFFIPRLDRLRPWVEAIIAASSTQ